jgi:betaine-aldehyde dehydrogenase
LADVISPSSEEVIARLPEPNLDDARLALSAAAAAFKDGDGEWPQMSLDERRVIVRRFCDGLTANMDDITHAWAVEGGMPIQTGEALAGACNGVLGDNLALSEQVELVEIRETWAGRAEIRHKPVGTTVAILTYNGPHLEVAYSVVPGLLVGNPIIVKLAPENRLLGYYIADAAAKAGFPDGILTIMVGDAEVSKCLVADPSVAAVHFTGGTEVGSDIMRTCADRIAHVTLELGGKSAAIIADDADLDEVAPALAGSMVMYAGQICIALTRILVPRTRHDDLVKRLVSAFGDAKIGDPLDPTTAVGPLAGKRVRDRVENWITRALADGAEVAVGGRRPAEFENGWYYEPTLLVNVNNKMAVAQDEIFGPVFCVIPYDTIEEAIEIANDSRYGLAGAVFSADTDAAMAIARRIRTGVYSINATFPCLGAPFGGVKQSGYGRELGMESFLELTEIQAIALP